MNLDAPHDFRLSLDRTLEWSRARSYRGFNKHDALNSPLLDILLGWSRVSRILAIQTVMRAPVDLRNILGVKPSYNPKGIALFARAWLDIARTRGSDAALHEARQLLELLLSLRSVTGAEHSAWGYHYPWQDLGFFAPPGTPNAVVTAFACEALLDGWDATGDARLLEAVNGAVRFFREGLHRLKETEEELCLSYMPLAVPIRMRVMDVSILIASVLARFERRHGADAALRRDACRLASYVARQQTPQGAWFYTDPPGDSPIRHDNYHTGFILDALARYMDASGDRSHTAAYDKGLHFYATHLFNDDGSPRWMSDRDFPHDVHGAAQGIITFARHPREYPGLARSVAAWALDTLYDPEGRFYYQQTRWFRKRFTLMRWCNAWMCRALAELERLEAGGRAAD